MSGANLIGQPANGVDSTNWSFGHEELRNNSGDVLPDRIPQADPELYKSIGFTGDPIVTSGGGDSTGGVESANPELAKFMADKGYKIGTRTGNADKGDPWIYHQTFDSAGNPVGKQTRVSQDDGGGAFGLVMGTLAAMATGGLAAGALAGAGVTGAAAAAGTGAAAGFGGTLATSADLGAALKGAAIGGVTGGIGGQAAGALGVTNPIGAGVINGAARGGVGALVTGGDVGNGVLMGGVKGAVPGVKKQIGFASGGVIPDVTGDPTGTADNLNIRVSGGEAILPADVVDALGPDFIHQLIAAFHTPAHAAT